MSHAVTRPKLEVYTDKFYSAGNKTGSHEKKSDSTFGKILEKTGELTKNQKLAEKGLEKREAAGYGEGRSDNY